MALSPHFAGHEAPVGSAPGSRERSDDADDDRARRRFDDRVVHFRARLAARDTPRAFRSLADLRGNASIRNLAVRVTAGGFVRYGVREDPSPGDTSVGFLETYGLDLGGGAIQRETLKFGVGSQAVALQIARPLGIVFEDVGGACVVVEVVPDSNAADAGVLPGDVLRMCSAVAKGKSTRRWASSRSSPRSGCGSKRQPRGVLLRGRRAVPELHGRNRLQRRGNRRGRVGDRQPAAGATRV